MALLDTTPHQSAAILPDSSQLVSQRTSLFDGKILNTDDTEIWGSTGTGTLSYGNSMVDMSVEVGQYCIVQSRRFMPYFSGKPQIVEVTCDKFETEPGVIKRVGYFSSSATPPYDTEYDGFWIEDNGITKSIKCANKGVLTLDIPFEKWRGLWHNHDYGAFNVFQFYFLWLGGAALTCYGVKPNLGFVHITNADFVGNSQGTITESPNQPLRYEIRSTTGTGNFRRICSQVSTAGSIRESGKLSSVYNATPVDCGSVGTTYVLKAVKKNPSKRNVSVKITYISCVSGATSDTGILLLLRNPTLSASLSYTENDNYLEATGAGETVTDVGKVIYSVPAGQEATGSIVMDDYLSWLSVDIDNTSDEYVLAFVSNTNNQVRSGAINLIEYV